jgi:hypothetical protein
MTSKRMKLYVQDEDLIAGLRSLAAQVGRSEKDVIIAALKHYVALQDLSMAFLILGQHLKDDPGLARAEVFPYEPNEVDWQSAKGIHKQYVVVMDERILKAFSELARTLRSELSPDLHPSERVGAPEVSEEEAITLANEQLKAVRIERARWAKGIAARYDLPEEDALEAARRNPRALAAADQVWSRSQLDEDEAMRIAKEELRAVRAGQ